MVTINPHTTRATGTVLTAAIYNADHQNHVTNATSINTDAAYKNVTNTFTAVQTFTASPLITKVGGGTLTINGSGNNGIEIGRTDNVASSAHIDFHSGTTGANDYDSRIIATSGTASNGGGLVDIIAATTTVNGNLTVTGTLTGSAQAFPSGTVMLFQQTAAPTGWTKLTVHNNKALRLTTGTVTTGGSVAFTTAFASQAVTGTNANTTATGTNSGTTSTGTVGGTALTEANLPAHSHGASGLTFTGNALPAHGHTLNFGSIGSPHSHSGAGNQVSAPNDGTTGTSSAPVQTTSAGTPSGTIGGTTASTGSGTTHTHSLTMNSHTHTFTGSAHTHTFTGDSINLAVQFVDVILASKD